MNNHKQLPEKLNAGLSAIPDASVDCCLVRLPLYSAHAHQVRALAGELDRLLKPEGSAWLTVDDSRTSGGLDGLPWRVAFVLQNDGWLLRNAVVVSIENGKCETVLFCVKQARYYFDLSAARSALGPSRGDVLLAGRAALADRVVLAACPEGGVVLDLTDGPEARAAADRWGRRLVRVPQAKAAA